VGGGNCVLEIDQCGAAWSLGDRSRQGLQKLEHLLTIAHLSGSPNPRTFHDTTLKFLKRLHIEKAQTPVASTPKGKTRMLDTQPTD